MTAARPPVTESDLLAYVDGRLDDRRRQVVEAHLLTCPQDAERVEADLAVMAGLRQLLDPVARAAPPAIPAARRPVGHRGRAWAARLVLALALLAGGFAGGLAASRLDDGADRMAQPSARPVIPPAPVSLSR